MYAHHTLSLTYDKGTDAEGDISTLELELTDSFPTVITPTWYSTNNPSFISIQAVFTAPP
jgi:hypothetical protein